MGKGKRNTKRGHRTVMEIILDARAPEEQVMGESGWPAFGGGLQANPRPCSIASAGYPSDGALSATGSGKVSWEDIR